MVKEKKGTVAATAVPAPVPEQVPVYTQEDMEYREDLLKKITTLEHVKGILIAREDAPIFINQIQDLLNIVYGWYEGAINKKPGAIVAGAEPGPVSDDDDGSDDDGSTGD